MDRSATVFACDDVLYSLTGKMTVAGMYTGDIVLFEPMATINQLIFFFSVSVPISEKVETLQFRVTALGNFPVVIDMPIQQIPPSMDQRRKTKTYRFPVLAQKLSLRPGAIETVVVLNGEEIDAGGVWVRSPT